MRAITLHQPYASLVANGAKTIETRSWAPPRALIGGAHRDPCGAYGDPATCSTRSRDLHPVGSLQGIEGLVGRPGYTLRVNAPDDVWTPLADYPFGAVVATARLDRIGQVRGGKRVEITPEPGKWLSGGIIEADPYGDFSVGRWLWFLEDIERVDPPIPAKGRQGFWEWEPGRMTRTCLSRRV